MIFLSFSKNGALNNSKVWFTFISKDIKITAVSWGECCEKEDFPNPPQSVQHPSKKTRLFIIRVHYLTGDKNDLTREWGRLCYGGWEVWWYFELHYCIFNTYSQMCNNVVHLHMVPYWIPRTKPITFFWQSCEKKRT